MLYSYCILLSRIKFEEILSTMCETIHNYIIICSCVTFSNCPYTPSREFQSDERLTSTALRTENSLLTY